MREAHRERERSMGNLMEEWATKLAEFELSTALPRRWAHTQGVAERATEIGQVLGKNAGLLVAAATLHDVGYAPQLAATGFHPLDGARFLRDEHEGDCKKIGVTPDQGRCIDDQRQRDRGRVHEGR
ncbi:HD domain-containing protein [Streptomyces halstedii]|uniref:HD domain-containing protein n=1 Tax=Streptomyces halstedii TaxID=1944 RepID=UPI003F4D7C60